MKEELIQRIHSVLYSNEYKVHKDSYWGKYINSTDILGDFNKLSIFEIREVFEVLKNIEPQSEMSYQEIMDFLEKKSYLMEELDIRFRKLNNIFENSYEDIEYDEKIYKVKSRQLKDLFGRVHNHKILNKVIDEENAEKYIKELREKIEKLEEENGYLRFNLLEKEDCT